MLKTRFCLEMSKHHLNVNVMSWLPEFPQSLQVELIANTPNLTSC